MDRRLTLIALVALCLAPYAFGVIIYSDTERDATLIPRACAGKPANTSVCHPLFSQRHIMCTGDGKGYTVNCGRNYYDYTARKCLVKNKAKVCPKWTCPASLPGVANATFGVAPLSEPIGRFGDASVMNATLKYDTPGEYIVYCPVYSHCQSGMFFKLIIERRTQTKSEPKVFEYKSGKIGFEEAMINTDHDPKKLNNYRIRTGDTLIVKWDEPIHFVVIYNVTDPNVKVPVIPYPPQPYYRCPEWGFAPDGSVPKVEGETRLVDFGETAAGVNNYTWTATKAENIWFVCPLATHCRMGQVFKATIKAAPADYTPVKKTISWMLTDYENFPDIELYVGDSLFFVWGGRQTFHMLSTLKFMKKSF